MYSGEENWDLAHQAVVPHVEIAARKDDDQSRMRAALSSTKQLRHAYQHSPKRMESGHTVGYGASQGVGIETQDPEQGVAELITEVNYSRHSSVDCVRIGSPNPAEACREYTFCGTTAVFCKDNQVTQLPLDTSS